MSIFESTAAMGARFAEARMSESCVITTAGGRVLDEQTGKYVEQQVVVYSGRCELKSRSEDGVHVDSGERDLMRSNPVLKVPASLRARVPAGATVVVETTNGSVTGTIGAEMLGPHRTARRFEVEVLG